MKLFDIFRSSRPQPQTAPAKPQPKPKVEVQRDYRTTGGHLSIEAPTLDAYYAAKSDLYGAEDLFKDATSVESLKSKDNKASDFDSRDGHVVLLDQKFEYHADTGKFQGHGENTSVTGDADTVNVESSDYKKERAVWDRKNDTFHYSYSETPYEGSSPTRSLLADEVFSISPDGKVTLPGATSLDEAKTVAPKRELAQRAEDLIQSATFWHDYGQKKDGVKGEDINPGEGAVVPNLPLSNVEKYLGGNEVMSKTHSTGGEFNDEEYPVTSLDLEATKNKVIVGNSDSPDTHLEASFEPEQMQVGFHFPDARVEEQVTWSKQDQTVRIQRFESGWQ